MKDLLKTTLVIGGMLALVLGVRVAAFTHWHNEMIGMTDPAPIAAADSGCGVMAVKMPCFRHAGPESPATASAPVESGPAAAETIASRDPRCGPRQVKFPCL